MAEPIEYKRIFQKVATYDEWMANPLILGDGEWANVRVGGVIVNYRIGDGTKRFSELPNVIQYDQAAYVAPSGNTLPVPQNGIGYSILTSGTYNGNLVVPEGNLGIADYVGNAWVVRNMVLPSTPLGPGGAASYESVQDLYNNLKIRGAEAKDFSVSGYVNNQGISSDSSTYRHTPPISVVAGEVVAFKLRTDDAIVPAVYFTAPNGSGSVLRQFTATEISNGFAEFELTIQNSGSIRANSLIFQVPADYYVSLGGAPEKIYMSPKDAAQYPVGAMNGTRQWWEDNSGTGSYINPQNGLVINNGNNRNRLSPFIAVKAGDTIEGSPIVTGETAAIAFYSTNQQNSFVSAIAGAGSSFSVLDFEFVAPSDGFIRLYSQDPENGSKPNPFFFSKTVVGTGSALGIKFTSSQGLNTPGNPISLEFFERNNGGGGRDGGGSTILTGLFQQRSVGGMVTIIDDDGASATFSYLWPMLQSKGLTFGSGICGGLIEVGSFQQRPIMTEEQFKVMATDLETVEILNHTFSHSLRLGDSSYQDQYNEIFKNHAWLNARGVHPSALVTPWGSYNDNTLAIASMLYKSHYTVISGSNTNANMRNYEIKRINFGGDGARREETIDAINAAISGNEWLVIMTHVAGYNDYPEWRSDFESVCDYINSSGIDCLRPSDAFNRIGNPIEVKGGQKIGIDLVTRSY